MPFHSPKNLGPKNLILINNYTVNWWNRTCWCTIIYSFIFSLLTEEVLSTDKAYWFSPRADSLVYLTLNDKKVEDAVYLTYGEPGSIQDQYQKEVKIRYPKAGTTPPEFTLWHVTLNDTLRPRKIDASKWVAIPKLKFSVPLEGMWTPLPFPRT